jgi:peptide/nickel transport system substrate-binding protein
MTGEVDWLEAPQVDLMPMLVANSDIVSKIASPYGKLGFIRLNCLQPPFDDVRLRRAVMRGVVQQDYMRAAFGDDASIWTECKSLWPRKTPYYSDDDASLVPGSLNAGRTTWGKGLHTISRLQRSGRKDGQAAQGGVGRVRSRLAPCR